MKHFSSLARRPASISCFQPLRTPRIVAPASYATMTKNPAPKLNDPSLFKQQAFINGEWVNAKSGKTFEVTGMS